MTEPQAAPNLGVQNLLSRAHIIEDEALKPDGDKIEDKASRWEVVADEEHLASCTALFDYQSLDLVCRAARSSTERRRARTGDGTRAHALSPYAIGFPLVTILRAQMRDPHAGNPCTSVARLCAWLGIPPDSPSQLYRAAAVYREAGILEHEDVRHDPHDPKFFRWRVRVMPRWADRRTKRHLEAGWSAMPVESLCDPALSNLDKCVLAAICVVGDPIQDPTKRSKILPPVVTLGRADEAFAREITGLGRDAWRACVARLLDAGYLRRDGRSGLLTILPRNTRYGIVFAR